MFSPLITREDTDSDLRLYGYKLLMIYSTPQDDKTCGVHWFSHSGNRKYAFIQNE